MIKSESQTSQQPWVHPSLSSCSTSVLPGTAATVPTAREFAGFGAPAEIICCPQREDVPAPWCRRWKLTDKSPLWAAAPCPPLVFLSHPLYLGSTSQGVPSAWGCFLEEQLLLCPQRSALRLACIWCTKVNSAGEPGLLATQHLR